MSFEKSVSTLKVAPPDPRLRGGKQRFYTVAVALAACFSLDFLRLAVILSEIPRIRERQACT